jgi:hypothetical protein
VCCGFTPAYVDSYILGVDGDSINIVDYRRDGYPQKSSDIQIPLPKGKPKGKKTALQLTK